jgi:ribA/ribD-fused uncharacterized protein
LIKATSSNGQCTPITGEEAIRNGHHEIRFYRANEKPYGAFSNLFRRPVIFEDCEFATAEHAYQAGKARKPEVREWILSAPTPSLVAMAAHGLYTWDIVPNWSQLKYERMRRVLHAKFCQHGDLRQLLLSTGDARLVEEGKVDNVVNRTWGEVNGKGLNMLGVLLMEVRSELRNELPTKHLLKGRRAPNSLAVARDNHDGRALLLAKRLPLTREQ